MIRKLISAGCAVIGVLGSVAASPAAQARTSNPFPDRLTAGQCLRYSTTSPLSQLESPSRRFSLAVYGNSLVLENQVQRPTGAYTSADVWRIDLNSRGRVASLCMLTGGNLVWRLDGRSVWSSRTSGRGNTARLLDGGNLVVRTAANRTLWSSGTTARLLRAGDQLASGRTLVARQGRSGSAARPKITTRLQMTRGGDLVLRSKKKRVWHSNTHVRGSRLVVTADGRLAVRTPAGRTVWRSPAVGRDAVMTVASKGRLLLHGRRCWVRPARSGDCYTG